jgi:salicylate hydroxylase
VVTFHSRQQEEWGVRDGSKEEVLSYFAGIHPRPRQMLDKPTSWRRWSTADREPVEKWGTTASRWWRCRAPGGAVYGPGACMALEDAVTLGKALQQCDGDAADAFALYESVRIPRTARIVWSTREMGRVYHAAGVERQVRNLLWKDKSQAEFYRGMEWLYGWKEDNCLLPR